MEASIVYSCSLIQTPPLQRHEPDMCPELLSCWAHSHRQYSNGQYSHGQYSYDRYNFDYGPVELWAYSRPHTASLRQRLTSPQSPSPSPACGMGLPLRQPHAGAPLRHPPPLQGLPAAIQAACVWLPNIPRMVHFDREVRASRARARARARDRDRARVMSVRAGLWIRLDLGSSIPHSWGYHPAGGRASSCCS